MKNMNVLAKAITLGIMLSTPLLTYAESSIVNEDKAFVGDTTYDVPYQSGKNVSINMNDGKEHTISVEQGKLTIIGNPVASGGAVVKVTNGSTLNLLGDISLTNKRGPGQYGSVGGTAVKIDGAVLNVGNLETSSIGEGFNLNNATINGDGLSITVNEGGPNDQPVYRCGIRADGTSSINAATKVVVEKGKEAIGLEIEQDAKITFGKTLELKVTDASEYAFGIYSERNLEANEFNGVKIDVIGAGSKASASYGTGNVGGYFRNGTAIFNGTTTINAAGHTKYNHGLYITQANNGNYEQSNIAMDVADITASGGKDALGVELINSTYKVNNLQSTVSGASDSNTGIWVKNGHMEAESLSIDARGSHASGLVIGDNHDNQKHDNTDNKNSVKNLIINAESDASNRTYGIYFDNSKDSSLEVENANITVRNTDDENRAYAISSEFNANIKFTGKVVVDAKKAIYAMGTSGNKNSSIIDIQKDFISIHKDSVIAANQDANVLINSGGQGTVQYSGIIDNTAHFDESWDEEQDVYKEGTINFNMNNADSYWNLTGDSKLNTLNIANGAKLDMTADGGKFSTLHVKELTGSVAGAETNPKNIIKMGIKVDESGVKNDRVYVDGVHNGTHFIDIPVLDGANIDGAEGTVLVSVKNEKGEFKANDSEGQVFWEHYDLDKYETAEGDEVTNGYTTDWYVKDVSKVNKPTTGVDSVLSMNSLNYHTWRTENDNLLQRMGELRHNGEEEKGAWFRVKGSKIGYDGGFENKYTTYELGYDEVTKRTEDVVRYQGAAMSYVDGKSSYNSGSGDNHGKSIGFYTTEQYSKGHYLDLVFKISNMDNDFKVFDTKGNAIIGEYDNTGVSISAEYGRKNDLDHGWYIEPQAQLTLGYMGGASYVTDNGISVDQSGIKSALGRIGFNIGKQIGERGIVYAKANLLHEFGGGYDVAMEAKDGSLTVSNTYNDTWFEYGVGVALATSDNSHIYFDVERSTGSDFYKDWQWNAGMRWSF